MPMLTPAQVAQMQTLANRILDTPVTIWRAPAPQATGTWAQPTATPVQIGSCNALFTIPSGPLLAQYVAMIGALVVWTVSVPNNQDVKTGDQLKIVATGETFKVHDARAPQSYSPLLTLVVAELR